jgi:hypothetical protein
MSELKPSSREIIAARLGCAPEDFLVYREEPTVIVAILPDGRKFKFTADSLTRRFADSLILSYCIPPYHF